MKVAIKRPYSIGVALILGLASSALYAETDSDWGERALNIQTTLDNDAPFLETSWVGAHNAMANDADDDYWDDYQNQTHGLTTLMELGVRQILLDVHYSGDNTRVCHNNLWSGGECMDGITGYRTLNAALEDITDFIDYNPSEVIFLKLSMASSASSHKAKVKEKVVNNLTGYALETDSGITTHGDYGSDGATGLPADTITKSKILSMGANVVVQGSSSVWEKSDYNDIVFYDRGGMNRTYDGSTKTTADTGDVITPSEVSGLWAGGENIIETAGFGGGSAWAKKGEDALQPEDMVWSWDRDSTQPAGAGDYTLLSAASDRFHDDAGTDSHYAACRKLVESDGSRSDADWILTSASVTFAEADNQCLTDGGGEYFFATPRNKVELDILVSVRDSAGHGSEDLWINYGQNSAGTWIADIGEMDQHMYEYCDEGGTGSICGHVDTYMDLVGLSSDDFIDDGYVDDKPASLTYSTGELNLYADDAIYTQNRKLVMQSDGNLVLYYYTSSTDTVGTSLWSSRTSGSNYYAKFNGNGNFKVYNSSGNGKWDSDTNSKGETINLQSDGNLVIRNGNGTSKWSSGTSQ